MLSQLKEEEDEEKEEEEEKYSDVEEEEVEDEELEEEHYFSDSWEIWTRLSFHTVILHWALALKGRSWSFSSFLVIYSPT